MQQNDFDKILKKLSQEQKDGIEIIYWSDYRSSPGTPGKFRQYEYNHGNIYAVKL